MSVMPYATAPFAAEAPPMAALIGPPIEAGAESGKGEAGGGFGAVLAGLNPLQHLPIIGMIYRAVTGERIEPGWRLAGAVATGALMGGPVGIVTSLVGVGLEELFHQFVGDVAAAVNGPPDPVARSQALAAYRATMNCTASPTWEGAGGVG